MLESQMAALERRRENLLAQYDDLRERAQMLDEKGIEMTAYERQVELLNKAFLTYAEKKETSLVNVVMDQSQITSVSIVQPPLLPLKPVTPRKMLNLMVSLFMGLALGVFYAFVAEQLAGTINTPDDMKRSLGEATVIFLAEIRALAEKPGTAPGPPKGRRRR
jgi:uncharacterized protein involved in exopolysaccharide biosynthesis